MRLGDSVIRYSKGKMTHTNFSFDIPENYDLELQPECGAGYSLLIFHSPDDKIIIEINVSHIEGSARDGFEEVMADEFIPHKIIRDYAEVKRGKGTALSLCYGAAGNWCPTYREIYTFEKNKYGENCVDIQVYLFSRKKKKIDMTILEALEVPDIKTFLNSIEYY